MIAELQLMVQPRDQSTNEWCNKECHVFLPDEALARMDASLSAKLTAFVIARIAGTIAATGRTFCKHHSFREALQTQG